MKYRAKPNNIWSDLQHLENMWAFCDRSWCWCMSQHALHILRYRSLFLLSVSVVVLWVSSLEDARTLHGSRSSLCLHSPHRHTHVSCALWVTSSTSPFTSSPISSSLLSYCSSCCLAPSTSLMSWITSPRTSAEELGLHRLWVQQPLHHGGFCRVHPGVFDRATIPWRLRLRWSHHRSDAPQCVPKMSRSLWRRRLVVLSVVVVNESW